MGRAEAIELLQAHADTIRRFGVTALFIYGSTARGEARETSDIDLFADVDWKRFGFVPFMDLREFLAGLLGRPVDFTTRTALHPDLRNRIAQSAVKVFDDATIRTVAAE